jgi:hypothetical protein
VPNWLQGPLKPLPEVWLTARLGPARYAAWQMGRGFGMAAGLANADRPQAQIAPLLEQVRSQASALGVPAPELPRIQHHAMALAEFGIDLDADRQCVAAHLERRYTPVHGHIYRFGVAVGHAALYCASGVCGTFGSEIRRYGHLAGVPDFLWLPMLQDRLPNGPGTPQQQLLQILARLDEHVRASP